MSETLPVPFEVEQRWRDRTRPDETSATLQIVRIRTLPIGAGVLSIHVAGIRLRVSDDGRVQDCLPHAPIDEPSLRGSVAEIVTAIEDGWRHGRTVE